MAGFRFVYLADCQLGCRASLSGLGEDQLAELAANDIHVAPMEREHGFAWELERLDAGLARARELSAEFVVVGGDMVHDPRDEQQYEAVSASAARSDVPVHWVAGNHDAAFDTIVPTPDSIAHYRRRFGPDTYAFDHAGTAFVVVDTVVWDHPEHVGVLLEEQLAWLETELAAARSRGVDHVLVLGHHPLFVHDVDEPDSYWNIPTRQRHLVVDLLTRQGVRAFFAGHLHRNGGARVGDLEIVITSAAGMPLGQDPSGLRVVDVGPDRVTHAFVALDDEEPVARSDLDVEARGVAGP